MTDKEQELVEDAIKWRKATKTFQRELLFEQLRRSIDMVIKERRDSHAKNVNNKDVIKS